MFSIDFFLVMGFSRQDSLDGKTWAVPDLNGWPPACQADALTKAELTAHIIAFVILCIIIDKSRYNFEKQSFSFFYMTQNNKETETEVAMLATLAR